MDDVGFDRFDRVLLRLAATNDDQLSTVLWKVLPLIFEEFLTLGRPIEESQPVPSTSIVELQKRKLIEIINHILCRLRGDTSIKININGIIHSWNKSELFEFWRTPQGTLLRNLLPIFVDVGLERIKFESIEDLNEATAMAQCLVSSFHLYRRIGIAPLAMYTLSSLLDSKILLSQERLWNIGASVWDAWECSERAIADSVISDDMDITKSVSDEDCTLDGEFAMEMDQPVTDKINNLMTAACDKIDMLIGLSQTLVELFLLPVNFDQNNDGIIGIPVETANYWKTQIRGPKTSESIWSHKKSRLVDWLCSTSKATNVSTTATRSPVRDSFPPTVAFIPLLIASFDSYDVVRLRSEIRVASLVSAIDFNNCWLLGRILHTVSSRPLNVTTELEESFNMERSEIQIKLLSSAPMPSVVSFSIRLGPKVYSKLFDLLKKSSFILQPSSNVLCFILSDWAVQVSLDALQQNASSVNQINALELLLSMARTFLFQQKESSKDRHVIKRQLDALLDCVLRVIFKTLKLSDQEILSTSILPPAFGLLSSLASIAKSPSTYLNAELYKISFILFGLLDRIAQLPSTTLTTAITDVSSLLKCLGLLAKALSVCLPSLPSQHRSWDTIMDISTRSTIISQFVSIQDLMNDISLRCLNTRASKCEALRWTAMLFPSWHPSYRILAVSLSSDSDYSVSALAKQLASLKPISFPFRECFSQTIATLLFASVSSEAVSTSNLLDKLVDFRNEVIKSSLSVLGLPLTADRTSNLIEFILKCPSSQDLSRFTSNDQFLLQLKEWLVLFCLGSVLINTYSRSNISNTTDATIIGSVPKSDRITERLFNLFHSRFDTIIEGVWSPQLSFTNQLQSYRNIGAEVISELFFHPCCPSELRNCIKETTIKYLVEGNPSDLDVGHYIGSVMVVQYLIKKYNTSIPIDQVLWCHNLYESIIHSTLNMVSQVQQYFLIQGQSSSSSSGGNEILVQKNCFNIIFTFRCLPACLLFMNYFILNPPNTTQLTLEVLFGSTLLINSNETFLKSIGYISEQLVVNDSILELGGGLQPYMKRELRRQLWCLYGTILGHQCVQCLVGNSQINELPDHLISSIEHFILTSTSKYTALDAAFTGEAIIDLIKICLENELVNESIMDIGAEIFDIVLKFAVPQYSPILNCTSLASSKRQDDMDEIKVPVERLLKLNEKFDNERTTEDRSQTCAFWLTMILQRQVAEKLLPTRFETTQLALIGHLATLDLTLSCCVWRGLIILEVTSFCLYYDTTLQNDRDKNIPLALAYRGLYGMSEYLVKIKSTSKNEKTKGPIKNQKLRDILSDSSINEKRLELLSQFCQIAKDLDYPPLLFGLLDQTSSTMPILLEQDLPSQLLSHVSVIPLNNNVDVIIEGIMNSTIQISQIRTFLFPEKISIKMILLLYYPNETIKGVINAICRHMFGFSSLNELLDSDTANTLLITEKNQLIGDILSSIMECLRSESSSITYREASISALSTILRFDIPWSISRQYLRYFWMTIASILDNVSFESKSRWMALAHSLRTFTIRCCTPSPKKLLSDVGEALSLSCEIIRSICLRYSNNKQISLLCMDTLKQSIENGDHLIRPYLSNVVPFLIESLAALEPAEFNFASFHVEREFNISQETFMENRLSLSAMTPTSQILYKLAKFASPISIQQLTSPLCLLLTGGVGIPTRVGVLLFIENVILQNGSSIIPKKSASQLFNTICQTVFDSSSSVSKRSANLLGYLAASVESSKFLSIFERRILNVLDFDDANTNIISIRIAVGQTIQSLNTKSPDVFNQFNDLVERIVSYAFVLRQIPNNGNEDNKCSLIWDTIWRDLTETERRTIEKYEKGIIKKICQTLVSQRREDRVLGATAALQFLAHKRQINTDVFPIAAVTPVVPSSFDLLEESIKTTLLKFPITESVLIFIEVGLKLLKIKSEKNENNSTELLNILLNILSRCSAIHKSQIYHLLCDEMKEGLPLPITNLYEILDIVQMESPVANESFSGREMVDAPRWNLWAIIICTLAYSNQVSIDQRGTSHVLLLQQFFQTWIAWAQVTQSDQKRGQLFSVLSFLIQYLNKSSSTTSTVLSLFSDGSEYRIFWNSIEKTLIDQLEQCRDNEKPSPLSTLSALRLIVDILSCADNLELVKDQYSQLLAFGNEVDDRITHLINLDGFGNFRRLLIQLHQRCESMKSKDTKSQ